MKSTKNGSSTKPFKKSEGKPSGKPGYNSGREVGVTTSVNPQLVKDTANVSFGYATGSVINLKSPLDTQLNLPEYQQSGRIRLPGIMCIGLSPSFGYAIDESAPINVAKTALFNEILSKVSGNRPYDSNDVILTVAAVAGVYDWIEFLKHIYKMATTFSHNNLYMYRSVFSALNIDYDDVTNDLSNLRAGINMLISQVTTFVVPDTIPYFRRNRERFSCIYTEGNSTKDQLYLFYPRNLVLFSTDPDEAGQLLLTPGIVPSWVNPGYNYTTKDLINIGKQLLNPIRSWIDDHGRIISDIKTAFGERTMKMELQSEEVAAEQVIFDIAALEQIKNATVFEDNIIYNSTGAGIGSALLVQDSTKGFLRSIPYVYYHNSTSVNYADRFRSYAILAYGENRILTTSTYETDPTLVLSNAALMAIGDPNTYSRSTDNDGWSLMALDPGTDIALDCGMVAYYWVESGGVYSEAIGVRSISYVNSIDTTDTAGLPLEFLEYNYSTSFKYHPAEHQLIFRQSATNPDAFNPGARQGFNFDFDNIAVLTYDDMRNMHYAQALAQWNVPQS